MYAGTAAYDFRPSCHGIYKSKYSWVPARSRKLSSLPRGTLLIPLIRNASDRTKGTLTSRWMKHETFIQTTYCVAWKPLSTREDGKGTISRRRISLAIIIVTFEHLTYICHVRFLFLSQFIYFVRSGTTTYDFISYDQDSSFRPV